MLYQSSGLVLVDNLGPVGAQAISGNIDGRLHNPVVSKKSEGVNKIV